jgi:hypothetical protein
MLETIITYCSKDSCTAAKIAKIALQMISLECLIAAFEHH